MFAQDLYFLLTKYYANVHSLLVGFVPDEILKNLP